MSKIVQQSTVQANVCAVQNICREKWKQLMTVQYQADGLVRILQCWGRRGKNGDIKHIISDSCFGKQGELKHVGNVAEEGKA